MPDPRDVFIQGKNVILKALSEDDVTNSGWHGWFNDAETTRFMQQRYFPNTMHKQLKHFQDTILGTPNKIQLGILPKGEKQIVGVTSLDNIDFLNRKADISIIIGEKKFLGRGLGTEAIKLLLGHAFGRLNLHKIGLGVLSGHKAAIRSYEKAGFVIEGTLKDEVLLDGQYHDVTRMGILAENFKTDL
ncbi:MAG: GNAT family protein [Desulfurivibrionaceae bacterium]